MVSGRCLACLATMLPVLALCDPVYFSRPPQVEHAPSAQSADQAKHLSHAAAVQQSQGSMHFRARTATVLEAVQGAGARNTDGARAQTHASIGNGALRSTGGASITPMLNATCVRVHPTFCTMVDWDVTKARIPDSNTELMVQIMYHNMPGTPECKKEFKQLMCRQSFPMCKLDAKFPSELIQTPCRSSCEAFAKRCPGANMQCTEFIEGEGCVEYKYLSARAFQIAHVWGTTTTVTGWPSVVIAAGVLLSIMGAALGAAKFDQLRVDAKAKRERAAVEDEKKRQLAAEEASMGSHPGKRENKHDEEDDDDDFSDDNYDQEEDDTLLVQT